MIKPEELRIGNWVFLKSKQKEFQITSGYEIDKGLESDDFEGIPLSPEWLERFGAYKTNSPVMHNEYCIQSDGGELAFLWGDRTGFHLYFYNSLEATSLPHINTVHRFQNLYLDIEGKELELKQ